eukprot:GSChrysophyteH2.ASY1.ANO1.469.1 assembled CDS
MLRKPFGSALQFRPRVFSCISQMSAEERAHPRWAEIWNGGLEPGQAFDAKTPSPCLVNEIKNGRIPNGKALVPGCGRGYDVLALATKERKVLGIDLAEKAVEAASKLNDTCEYRENASFEVGDFFALSETSSYDFIYDYTFLCALHPSVQQQWATKMTELQSHLNLVCRLLLEK